MFIKEKKEKIIYKNKLYINYFVNCKIHKNKVYRNKMYYLTTIDVLEYLVKRNSENILLNDCNFKQIGKKQVNLNFLKKHLFYDIEYFFKKNRKDCPNVKSEFLIENVQNIKIIDDKIYILFDLKKTYEYFKTIFQCNNWISIDYLNFNENYQYLNYPILKLDINCNANTDFKDIITKALKISISEILKKGETSLNIIDKSKINETSSFENYVFVEYKDLHKLYTNSDNLNDDIGIMKEKFHKEFKNIFLLF